MIRRLASSMLFATNYARYVSINHPKPQKPGRYLFCRPVRIILPICVFIWKALAAG
jgi:hypothetical protein